MLRISNRFYETAVYSLSASLQAAMGFLLLPVITLLISIEGYGQYAVIVSFTTIVSTIAFLGMSASLSRQYYTAKSPDQQNSIFTLGLVITFVGALLQILIITLYSNQFTRLVFNTSSDHDLSFALCLGVAYSSIQILSNYISIIFRLERKALQALIYSLSLSILTIISLLLIYYFINQPRLSDVFIALILAGSIHFCLYFFALIPKKANFSFDTINAISFVSYGLNSVSASFFLQLYLSMDLLLAQRFFDETRTGQLATILKLACVYNIICSQPVAQVLPYYIYENIQKDDIRLKATKAFNLFIIFSVMVCALLSFSSDLIPNIWTSNKLPHNTKFMLFMASSICALNGCINFTSIGFNVKMKLQPMAIGYSIFSALKLCLISFFTYFYEMNGLLISSAVASFLFNISIYKKASAYFSYLVDNIFVLRHLLPFIILVVAIYLMPSGMSFTISALWLSVSLITYAFLLYCLRLIQPTSFFRR